MSNGDGYYRSTYRCYNRVEFKPTVWVQDGWTHSPQATSRLPRMQHIPFRMEGECQYQKDDRYNDPGCLGCSHNLRNQQDGNNPHPAP